ncbi:hypothetical protein PLESTM_000866600 [Pleodorina starrii]|nr:hypothetical protein PLESTM_000866600 [Pleodorina starrii]
MFRNVFEACFGGEFELEHTCGGRAVFGVCTICLNLTETGPAEQLCGCPTPMHRGCLGRWQLERTLVRGRRRPPSVPVQNSCPFCRKLLPPLAELLTPRRGMNVVAFRAVAQNGKRLLEIPAANRKSGAEGKTAQFRTHVNGMFGMLDDAVLKNSCPFCRKLLPPLAELLTPRRGMNVVAFRAVAQNGKRLLEIPAASRMSGAEGKTAQFRTHVNGMFGMLDDAVLKSAAASTAAGTAGTAGAAGAAGTAEFASSQPSTNAEVTTA